MVKDAADTDFVCRTAVSCYVLPYSKFKQLVKKRNDLKETKRQVGIELDSSNIPVALDYIFHNNVRSSEEDYRAQLRMS